MHTSRQSLLKPAIVFIAVVVSACAGSTEPIKKTPTVALDSCAVARPDLGAAATQADLAQFSYDATAPLNFTKVVETTAGGVEVSEISYDSPAGGRVTGVLFIPLDRTSPRPAIIFMHGAPGSSRDGWLTNDAQAYAKHGAVVIAIDAPFARRGGASLLMTKQDKEEQIQLMKDLQRAVDLLRAQPNVDKDRIAYVGVSYGGAMGVQFAAIEHRLKAVALVVGDGGSVMHNTQPGGLIFLATLSCATRAAWFHEMIPIEPIRFFAFAKPTPLLLQNGKLDEFISESDAQLLHNAAPEPKKVIWYNTGHTLGAQAVLDRHNWLVEQIGLDPL